MADPASQAGQAASPTTRLLLVDDDAELCDLMREYLVGRGFAVEAVRDGRLGLARALGGEHDLVLLDVMLPGLDGFELLRQLRRRSAVPVIMLTARTAPEDRVAGLDGGADDYLPKPFGPEELIARIRAVLRRSGGLAAAPQAIEALGVRLLPGRREVTVDGNPLETTSTEFDLLELLVRSAGRAVSRRELTAVLYQRQVTPFDRVLDVHVSHIRKKLGPRGDLIRTVRGVGYLFCAEAGGAAER
ncbi:Response regulator ArlR [Aquisphaera giovannonii]|uniref:Response regulator ArlR n=1 Tax=Aquisphaera giovannonii TaxID=406548 RepID=A0A5B9WBJ9_9BACT|nr:response regulator transcription factor [Aquisphaera giovannonii]QEH37391.1 Response regulator ArlR [Aquisphaera giovannonii]